jgi:hypothetical protein
MAFAMDVPPFRPASGADTSPTAHTRSSARRSTLRRSTISKSTDNDWFTIFRVWFCKKGLAVTLSPEMANSFIVVAPPSTTSFAKKGPFGFSIMPTDRTKTADHKNRIPTREELTRFYRAIGISAVASAAQAAKMTGPIARRETALPAFLRDIHAVG